MTAPRIVVAGATTALTRRTTLRKAFLAPWDPMVEQCFLYALADAQRQTGVAVHHSVRVVTHHHTSVTPEQDNMPEFTRRFHRDVSCSLHALLCAQRYDAPRELFDDRPAHMMRLVDAEAQASHLVYEYLNTSAAGLVQRPEHMPGRTLDFDLWKVGYIEVERPPFYFEARRPERLRLELTPPPLLYRAFGGDIDRLVYHMKRLAEGALRSIRAARRGSVLGARQIERLHPWSEPRTLREAGGQRAPSFRIGACGIVGRSKRIEGALEVRSFRFEHRACRKARRNGDLERRFPFGTYAMRAYHGAPVEPEPAVDAMIAMPGPLLCDVDAELARNARAEPALREAAHALLDAVRDALQDEAGEIVDDAVLDLVEPTAAPQRADARESSAADGAPDHDRSPAVVKHRLDPRRPAVARRVITLRDRRRGRPRRTTGTHGSDPPG